MSLVKLANVCSHLQNASLARLGLTSIPHTRMHLLLAVQLQKQGFISNVVLAGSNPPSKLLPRTESVRHAFESADPVTQVNRATRRLWLSLKYWDGEPVMRKLKMLSRPSQKLWLSHDDLSRIVRGKRANYIEGMTRVGECIFLSTDKGIMEARECVERRIGGLHVLEGAELPDEVEERTPT
ncbi:hypothetical protein ANO11243_064600 [Dothideomycetidae sp. 11243]|nr:hypothetical protein ANO11243_064600 [fungal sp. No.11243]